MDKTSVHLIKELEIELEVRKRLRDRLLEPLLDKRIEIEGKCLGYLDALALQGDNEAEQLISQLHEVRKQIADLDTYDHSPTITVGI